MKKEFSRYVGVCLVGMEDVHEVFMLRFEDVGAYVGGSLYAYQFLCGNCTFRRAGSYLSYVIESEGALALDIVVSPIIERVVLAYQDLKARSDITLLE